MGCSCVSLPNTDRASLLTLASSRRTPELRRPLIDRYQLATVPWPAARMTAIAATAISRAPTPATTERTAHVMLCRCIAEAEEARVWLTHRIRSEQIEDLNQRGARRAVLEVSEVLCQHRVGTFSVALRVAGSRVDLDRDKGVPSSSRSLAKR